MNWFDRLDAKVDGDIIIGIASYVFLLGVAGLCVWVIVR
jgi:hypothetical protein